MRACGCVINDLADSDVDRSVARTRDRPLTAGRVTEKEALGLMAILLTLALGLVLCLNLLCLGLSCLAITITAVYPFCKRFFVAPQIVLGVAFSWGIPMAYAAVHGSLQGAPWLLWVAAWLWPIAYDTEYAMADRAEDLKIGLHSSAILFGKYDRLFIALIQSAVIILLWLVGRQYQLTLSYYLGLVVAMVLMVYQQWLIRHRDNAQCFRAFRNNHWLGMGVFLGLVFSLW